MTPAATSKQQPLAVAQAKVIRADGSVEYHISKPQVHGLNLRGRLWAWRAVRRLKRERRGRHGPAVALVLTVFTTTGKAWAVDKLQDEANAIPASKYCAWGTGSTPEAAGNTTLHVEANEGRALGVLSQPAADVDRLVATLTANATKNITECGRFTASSGGTMTQRSLFTAIPMVLNDRIEFTQDLQVT